MGPGTKTSMPRNCKQEEKAVLRNLDLTITHVKHTSATHMHACVVLPTSHSLPLKGLYYLLKLYKHA